MEESFRIIASYIALAVEAAAVLTVTAGAVEALVHLARHLLSDRSAAWTRRRIWLRFASWILLSLEFALGADIIRTAIAPTWDDIGKLAAIAAVRTALNFFLGRDLETAMQRGELAPDQGTSSSTN